MRALPARVSLLAAVAALLAACGGSSDGTTAPPSPAKMTPAASAYLQQALDWEQQVFLYGKQINWPSMRADVVAKAGAAQKPSDTYAAIQYSIDHYFRPLGDAHSAFWTPDQAPGRSDAPPDDPRYQVQTSMMTSNIAYISVPSFVGKNLTGHADTSIAAIKALDVNKPCGWIVDLRLNNGGYWASMLAGLSPLVGNGDFAGFVDADSNRIVFYIQNGATWIRDPVTGQTAQGTQVTSPYVLSHTSAPVAILQGPNTASAGELIVLAFKGSTVPARTFGTPTYGVTTTPFGIYLQPDSAYLNITGAVMFDRTGKVWGQAIPPDQTVAGPSAPPSNVRDNTVNAAITWLQSRPECGGSGSVQPSIVMPFTMPPGRTGPRTRPLTVPDILRARIQ